MTTAFFPLRLNSEFISEKSPNYEITVWPPSNDFPVTCDKKNKVVSRFEDDIWDFTSYCNKNIKFNFGSSSQKKGYIIDFENKRLFKIIACYWLWGAGSVFSVKNLIMRLINLKPLVYICSVNNILISDLNKNDWILEKIASQYGKHGGRLIFILKILFANHKEIGFKILDNGLINRISNYLIKDKTTQTPYIPPRIWVYQNKRLEECLTDFLENQEKIIYLFNYMLDVYKSNNNRKYKREVFLSLITELDLTDNLNKWIVFDENGISIRNFSSYLSLISFAAIAYIINFSLMRIDEASKLRYGCFVSKVINNEKHYFIQGETSKTVKSKEAFWIVPHIAKKAVDAISIISQLRFGILHKNGFIEECIDDFKPHLYLSSFEPWTTRAFNFERIFLIPIMRKYNEALTMWPKLFNLEQLTIQNTDLKIAKQMTFGLDEEKFKVGCIWPLAWHQLRRTGAVNMIASGFVEDASLQYQLKHSNKFMSLYYANNAYKLNFNLNEQIGELYLQERFQNHIEKYQNLEASEFVSPHGVKRKIQVISTVKLKDHATLLSLSKSQKLNYRETFLGACTKSGDPCPYGGITNITMCMGTNDGLPCDSVMLDKNKLNLMYELEDFYQKKMDNYPYDSIPAKATLKQLVSIRKAIDVIKSSE